MTSKLDYLKKYMTSSKTKQSETKKRELKLLQKYQNSCIKQETVQQSQAKQSFTVMESDSSDKSERAVNKPAGSSDGDTSSEPRRRGRRLDDSASSSDDSDNSCGQNGEQAEDDAIDEAACGLLTKA